MDDMIGFVIGNSQRERVIQVLGSKGPLSMERIAKIERMTPPTIKRVLQELAEKGLIAESGGVWSLSERGVEIEKELKRRS